MILEEKTIKRNDVFDGKIISVHVDDVILPDGSISFREIVDHQSGGGVCVAPLTENGELIMVRQFRYPYGRELLEVPAGKLEKGESPVDTGRRELFEEIGCKTENMIFLGEIYPTVAYCSETIYAFAAAQLSYTGEQHLDSTEFLNVVRVPFEKAVEMVENGEIKDSKTQITILKLARLLNK
ncbi:MAG: NUDIX hydrolase [Clostridia bacterium]|nr:NUDIX hydrolase [Clostridia bacterium]